MFSETLLDHARYPHNCGPLDAPDAVGHADFHGRPPITKVYLRQHAGRISGAAFETFGCGVSVAVCSILTDLAKGQSIERALAISTQEIIHELEGVPEDRRFCADLALQAFRQALQSLQKSN